MFAEFRSFSAWTLIRELNHLDDVLKIASDRKNEIEDVLKLMNFSEYASASINAASEAPDNAPTPNA